VLNPGRLLLLLPPELAAADPGTAAAVYRKAVEEAVNEVFSTGANDARGGRDQLTVQSLDYRNIHLLGARAAAIRVLDQFLEDLRQHADS
jgi:hypothetical protein